MNDVKEIEFDEASFFLTNLVPRCPAFVPQGRWDRETIANRALSENPSKLVPVPQWDREAIDMIGVAAFWRVKTVDFRKLFSRAFKALNAAFSRRLRPHDIHGQPETG